jgi:transcriptional regulatory protein LevR
MAARFSSTDADEFTLQQQNVKTKAATKYAVKVLSNFMLEYNYDGEIGTMDIVVLNGILQDLRECQNQQVEIIILEAH